MMNVYTPLSTVLPEGIWPDALAESDETFLDKLACLIFDERADDFEAHVFIRAKVMAEARLPLPILQGLELVFGKGDSEETGLIDIDLTLAGENNGPPTFELKIVTTTLSLSLNRELFTPVEVVEINGQLQVTPQPGNIAIPLPFALTVSFDGNDWTLDFEVPAGVGTGLTLPLCALGDSGVVIEATDLELNFSGNGTRPTSTSAGWKGLYLGSLKLYLPQLFNGHISATGLGIGTGGLWGEFAASFILNYSAASIPHFTGDLATPLFGIEGGLREVNLSFMQSIPTAFNVKGSLLLPFFDEPVDIEIGIEERSGFTIALSANNGLYKLTKPGLLELELQSLSFELRGGLFVAQLGGQLTPFFGRDKGLDWPSFKVEELSIDSQGHVHLEGGWMALREQYELNFHIGITKLGFGKTEDDGKWVGFSGDLKLVDGFTAGASVEGLRITWYDDGRPTRISLNGIGVEFEIPDVLHFKGDVSYRELEVHGELVHQFDGDIKLNLMALDLKIDAKLIVGSASGPQGRYNFFALYLYVDLPNGMHLGSTPLSLYGMDGLFALQMEPDKRAEEEWYKGWYQRSDIGVTDLDNKWVNRRGSLALGCGVVIGTTDQGFTFACKALLVVVFPGPILLIEGQANLLKERAKLDDNPLFRALAVLDLRQGQILIGLDAKYKQDETSGRIIDIHAGAEAFFHTPDDWHLYLGEKEPREKRIRAPIFKLFESNAYFMLDSKRLATGAWVGFARGWKIGPAKLALEAWLEGNVVVNWNPLHFYGELSLFGSVELSLFGFGFGLSVAALFAADIFNPYHILARLEVSVRLFRKKRHFDIKLEWGPEQVWPTLPAPLKEVAVAHFKVTTSWPLAIIRKDEEDENHLPTIDMPVVPLDCRPHISFRRPVHDDALVGINPQPVQPEFERVGDPDRDEGPVKVRYALTRIELSKCNRQTQSWQLVAVADGTSHSGERTLFGSWAPMPQIPSGAEGQAAVANNNLWLWSRTPFDYTRHSGSDWDDWFTANFNDYPCVPQEIPDREVCCDFERLRRADLLQSPWQSPEHSELTLSWPPPVQPRVTVLDPPVNDFTHALCFPLAAEMGQPPPIMTSGVVADGTGSEGADLPDLIASNAVMVKLSVPAKRLKLWVVEEKKAASVCLDFRHRQTGEVQLPLNEQGVTIGSGGVTAIESVPTTLGEMTGLRCLISAPGALPANMSITLPCAATTVDLMLSYLSAQVGGSPAVVLALNSQGETIAYQRMQNPQRQPESIHFEGDNLRHLIIAPLPTTVPTESAVFLYELCFLCPDTTPSVTATVIDPEGNPTGVFYNEGNLIEVTGDDVTQVQLQSDGDLCLLKICALFGPDPLEVARRQEMAAHLSSEVTRWTAAGEVLEPFTTYRLTIETDYDAHGAGALSGQYKHKTYTEHAYFRTEGPPGLTKLTPSGSNADKFDSSLEDLTRYVRQTIPATVPAVGEKPVMAKPFYRAYDVGVEFNENYVDLMYRISGRDLGLYLYDSNNRPVRDAVGRLLVHSGEWGAVEELTLTEGEQRWVALSNVKDGCLPTIEQECIVHDRKLSSAIAGRVLEPDTVYEARLIPLLLHEDFRSSAVGTTVQGPAGTLGRWVVRDEGDRNTPSQWVVGGTDEPVSRYLAQTSSIKGGNEAPSDPLKPGTMLLFSRDPALDVEHSDQPAEWTDYRFSVYLRAAEEGALGVVFRYRDGDNYYRLALDCKNGSRRLVRVADGIHTLLKQDDFAFEPQRDYLMTVEAIGNTLRVYQDGALIFEVNDAALLQGSIGLYCYDNPHARFKDLRVDDFRQTAQAVYRFEFTTSQFANFFHHLHSYQDETWRVAVAGIAGARPAMARAVKPWIAPTEDEARAYETLAVAVLGPAARQNPPEVQVTRIEIDGEPLAFLVQSPEPIDSLRTEIAWWRSGLTRTEPALPGQAKIVAAKFGANQISIDSLVLLLREPMNLTQYQIESRLITWPVNIGSGVLLDEEIILHDGFQEPPWVPYHTFGAEGNLPAGTILQLSPSDTTAVSSAKTAQAQQPGLDADNINRVLRVSFSIQVRVVAPDGKVIHARHFLPDNLYLSEDISVLRKADGTGFFIVKLDGSFNATPFSLSQYRLLLAYRRDNRALAPGSPVLSEAGNQADEVVILDIPLQTN